MVTWSARRWTQSTSFPNPGRTIFHPLDKALEIAAQNRPEIEQADLNLRYQSIVIKANRNGLLPTLDFFATYASNGLSGVEPIYGACPAGYIAASTECINATTGVTTALPVTGSKYGGLASSLSQIFHNDYPNYSVGLSLADSHPQPQRPGRCGARHCWSSANWWSISSGRKTRWSRTSAMPRSL